MKQVLIIPDIHNLQETLALTEKYSLGYEYNDFFKPEVLENSDEQERLLQKYHQIGRPEYCTMHGAFLDVLPFSTDPKIRETSLLRIEQSIHIAKRIGASAVIFHTNYNPFLNSTTYIQEWLAQNVDIWSGFLEKNPDISIYLENMFDTTPEIMRCLSQKLCGYKNYGICLDYAHASISHTLPGIWAAELGEFVRHVHINDNDLVSDLHLSWGDGQIDRERFYRDYEAHMNGASVLIETNSIDNQRRSLEMLKVEGFI